MVVTDAQFITHANLNAAEFLERPAIIDEFVDVDPNLSAENKVLLAPRGSLYYSLTGTSGVVWIKGEKFDTQSWYPINSGIGGGAGTVSGITSTTEIPIWSDQAVLVSGTAVHINSSADNIRLFTETDDRPTINSSGIATLNDIMHVQWFNWNGFVDRSDSSISFDHSTRTLSIDPTATSYNYLVAGQVYTGTGDSVVVPSGTEGINVIYYDGSTLTNTTNPSIGQMDAIIRTKALVSIVYWGTVQQSGLYIGEERHGYSMSPDSHSLWHYTKGLQYLSGLGLNSIDADQSGNDDLHAVFGVDSGGVSDEDIYDAIAAVGSGVGLPIYYMTGSTPNWNRWTNSPFSMRTFDGTSSTRLAWNEFTGGSWQLTEATNAYFVLCHVFATTEKDYPMIAVMGQNEYNNRGTARVGALSEIFSLITDKLLFPEIRPIATVIFNTRSTYSNGIKARIVTTDDGDDYIDWRNENISRFTVSTSDHNALSNLQGGTAGQYYHMTSAENAGLVTRYYAHFDGMTSGTFVHGLNSNYINYNVYSSGTLVEEIIPDRCFIDDENNITLLFNKPQTGFVALVG